MHEPTAMIRRLESRKSRWPHASSAFGNAMGDVDTDDHGHGITLLVVKLLIMRHRRVDDDHESSNDGVEHSESIVWHTNDVSHEHTDEEYDRIQSDGNADDDDGSSDHGDDIPPSGGQVSDHTV